MPKKSASWDKRLRMSTFVQRGQMSFGGAPDPPPEDGQGIFHVLLPDGNFSKACVVLSPFGNTVWQYPIGPIGYVEEGGIWTLAEVMSWKEMW